MYIAVLVALASSACTAMYAGTASLTSDHNGNLGARLTASMHLGPTTSKLGDTPSTVWGPVLFPIPLEVGVGIDFGTGAITGILSTSVGYARHSGGDTSLRMNGRMRVSGDGLTGGPGLEGAYLWDLSSRERKGRCDDEGGMVYRSLGIAADTDLAFGDGTVANFAAGVRLQYASYFHEHPFTECRRRRELRPGTSPPPVLHRAPQPAR